MKWVRLINSSNKPDFDFSGLLIAWQKQHGRHNLPWQNTQDAYRIWLSEIMLQQTQVSTVIPYYGRFLDRFPTIKALAASSLEAVMEEWSGLGYYSRARNLHRCARQVVEEYGGHFPKDLDRLVQLPGIGRSTAAAIAVFSGRKKAAILDGNVIRVLSRVFGIAEYAGNKPVKDYLWELAESLLPDKDIRPYTQGLMDLGATVCIRSSPVCDACPFASYCVAYAEDRVSELPARKSAKVLPEKTVSMILLLDRKHQRVLLEKRPDSGIWGGLLSLPEKEEKPSEGLAAAIKYFAASFGQFASYQYLDSFTHIFSHFRLTIFPVLIEMECATEMASDGRYVWYALEKMQQAPLPSPVKKLLLRLAKHSDPVMPG